MDRKINPFHELYVTEILDANSYIKLFSPYLCNHTLSLFQPGNVVLKGTKGNGKSMLLRLLRPDTRIAYKKAGKDFPVPNELGNFIGASINLIHSGITVFGQRLMKSSATNDQDMLALYFGDFLNYWVVFDLLISIEKYQTKLDGAIAKELDMLVDPSLMNKFVLSLCSDDCWFDYLKGINDIKKLKERLSSRINHYKLFLNFNIDLLPGEIINTKTRIGEPISRTIKKMKDHGIISKKCHVFINIDQLEELTRMEALCKSEGPSFREIINRALGMRDRLVSYRIGSRRYAWNDNLKIYGTSAQLEEGRDYTIIDIDEMLRRKESQRTWIFPKFAEEVFKKRIEVAFEEISEKQGLLKKVLGNGILPQKIALKYAGTSKRRVVTIEKDWPKAWVEFLHKLAEKEPLSARLAEAWCRQQGEEKQKVMFEIPETISYPWDKKQYWKKERIGQALMQIAARCGQKLIWAGEKDVISLSGGNILAFLSLCNCIWSAWVRDKRKTESKIEIEQVDYQIQTLGIHEASTRWFDNIPTEHGGNKRQRFINFIGTTIFYKKMYEDKAMSYPGANGFSLKISELELNKEVKRFLSDAVDYGDLYDATHTTKTKDREKRKKWYLNPILSPYFKIPDSHTKEPLYITLRELMEWLKSAEEVNSNLETIIYSSDKK